MRFTLTIAVVAVASFFPIAHSFPTPHSVLRKPFDWSLAPNFQSVWKDRGAASSSSIHRSRYFKVQKLNFEDLEGSLFDVQQDCLNTGEVVTAIRLRGIEKTPLLAGSINIITSRINNITRDVQGSEQNKGEQSENIGSDYGSIMQQIFLLTDYSRMADDNVSRYFGGNTQKGPRTDVHNALMGLRDSLEPCRAQLQAVCDWSQDSIENLIDVQAKRIEHLTMMITDIYPIDYSTQSTKDGAGDNDGDDL